MSYWVTWTVVGFIVIGVGVYAVLIYNGLVSLQQHVKRAWSNIDVALKQRRDEVPNLVSIVKGYMGHEKTVFEEVTKARSMYAASQSIAEITQATNMLTHALGSIFMLAEDYPDLKANENFLKLQQRITEIEDLIADRREHYNSYASQFNIRIRQIPDVLIASTVGYEDQDLFKAEASSRAPVAISMDD